MKEYKLGLWRYLEGIKNVTINLLTFPMMMAFGHNILDLDTGTDNLRYGPGSQISDSMEGQETINNNQGKECHDGGMKAVMKVWNFSNVTC